MKPLNELEVVRKQKISQLANDVRKKYQALKLGRSEEDDTLNRVFKPITTPLKQLVEQQQQLVQQKQQQQQQHTEREKELIKREQQLKREQKQEKVVQFLPTYDVTSRQYESNEEDNNDDNDDSAFARDKATSFNKSIEEDREVFINEYLSQYPKNVHEYILNHFHSSTNLDTSSGPVYDPNTSRWKLGSESMNFANGKLIIGREEFNGTAGLYNLIFYKDPDKYTEHDLEQYKKIIEKTNIYRIGNSSIGRLKGHSGYKYKEIVKPLLAEKKARTHSTPTFKGSGFNKMLYSEKPTEYVYWDDVNELVDRLRLLHASKQAGNTSHNNEILSIIEELREAKVIY